MRARLRSLGPLAAIALACAGAGRTPERPAAYATPVPDPACRNLVAESMRLSGIEQVSVRVTVAGAGPGGSVELLAPELTPAQAEGVRRAFAGCAWSPGEGGAARGTVTFNRP